MYYFHLHFNLSPASSFLKESPQEIFQVLSQIFYVSNPITISPRDLGTLAEGWKTASFLLTGFMVISSVCSTQQPSVFPGSFWEIIFMGSKGFSLMALTDKHCSGEITEPLCPSKAQTLSCTVFLCAFIGFSPNTERCTTFSYQIPPAAIILSWF